MTKVEQGPTVSPAPTQVEPLKALAEKATPGPWGRIGYPYYEYWIVEKHEADASGARQVHPIASVQHAPCEYEDGWYKNTQRDANAAYIAAISPDVVLGLLATITQLQAETARLKESSQVHDYHDSLHADAMATKEAAERIAVRKVNNKWCVINLDGEAELGNWVLAECWFKSNAHTAAAGFRRRPKLDRERLAIWLLDNVVESERDCNMYAAKVARSGNLADAIIAHLEKQG